MWNENDELKKQLIMLEKLKAGIMKQINLNNGNEDAIKLTKAYPLAKVKPLSVNGYKMFRFSYDGMLPLFIEDIEYSRIIAEFYFHSTLSGFDFNDYKDYFNEVFIIFCQYFKDSVIRDLDNRNKKHIQDAIRHSRIIVDDNWKYVSNTNVGFLDNFNHTQVFVVEKENYIDFMQELLTNDSKYKCLDCIKENKQFFIESEKKKKYKQSKSSKKKTIKPKSDSFYN